MQFHPPALNLIILSPLLLILGIGTLIMLLELFVSSENMKKITSGLALLAFAGAFVQSIAMWGYTGAAFTPQNGHPMIVVDNFSTFLNIIFALTGLFTVLISLNYRAQESLERPEYYMLILFSIAGMMLMGMANDLIIVFMALELLSIPLYILSAFAWPRPESEESAMKYFFLGAFSSGIFVFGIALIYGATGSTALPEILAHIQRGGGIGMAGVAMLLVGLSFKVAAAPFHMWTPDVYEGAPTVVTAFMSVGAKVGGFAALIRIFASALAVISPVWSPALAGLAAITMVLGNVVALAQPNIKRMLAYSSIAHAGYIMMAVSAAGKTTDGISAALFYMFAYLFTNLGAFAIVVAMERQEGKGNLLEDYKGLAKKNPWMALAMAYFMLSLTGVPPTGGFSAKFFVFRAVLEANLTWLAVVGVITSVVSGYFYLRVVYLMYMVDGEGELDLRPGLVTAVALTIFVTALLGFLPGPWFTITREALFSGMHTVLLGQ